MMINSSGCTAGGCVDAKSPVNPKLHRWAEADREFLRRLCSRENDGDSITPPSRSPILFSVSDVDSCNNVHVGRQKYLQSYRFTRKEEESRASGITVSDRIVNKWRRLMIKSHPKKTVAGFSSSGVDRRPCYVFGFLFTCFTAKSSLLKRLT